MLGFHISFILGFGCGNNRSVLTSTLLYFITRVGNGILAIATLAIFTRLLSPSEYGVYALFIAIATVMSSIFFQWLTAAIGRFYPMYFQDPREIMAVIARWFWLATTLMAILYVVIFPLYEIFKIEPALIGILFMLTLALGRYSIALQIANSQSAHIRYCMLSWTKISVALIAGVLFVYFGIGGQGVLLGFLVGLVLALLIFEPKPRIGFEFRSSNVNAGISADMLSYGLPLTLNFLAIVLVDLSDRFMIGSFLGVSYIAPYAVAYDFVQLTVGPAMNIFALTAFPVIVHLFDSEKYEEASEHLQVLGCKILSLGLPIIVGLSSMSEDISKYLFGMEYWQDAAMIMPWLAIAIFIATFKTYFIDVAFQLHHATKYQGYIAVLMAVINIALNLTLLPSYGVVAAAWSTLAAFSVGAVVSWIIGKQLFSLPSLTDIFWKSIFASAAMVCALYFLPPVSGIILLIAKVSCGIFIYSVAAWVLDIASCRNLLYKLFK